MRWRNGSTWWGFHPFLSQPISCRNGLVFGRHRRFCALETPLSRGRWPQALERRPREPSHGRRVGYNSLSTIGMAHERLTPILTACPFVPEKFLKQFTAFLREHAAVDIAAMI